MSKLRVLVACEFSGIVRDAFAARGHDAWSCDLLPSERAGQHLQRDVLHIIHQSWDMMIAHPPCTYLSWAGNVWLKQPGRLYQREQAWRFFEKLIGANIPRIAIENPPGYPCQNVKPTQTVQPWQFGHSVVKKTCLWLKNLPLLVPTNPVKPTEPIHDGKRNRHWTDQHCGWNIEKRRRDRSRTFEGIAAAMASQWG